MQKISICLSDGIVYADCTGMDGSELEKINNINYIMQSMGVEPPTFDGIMLVRRDKLVAFFTQLPPEVLTEAVAKMAKVDVPKDVEGQEFRDWAKRSRILLGQSQSDIARVIGIRPEQISRFESGRFPLSDKHKAKLKDHLLKG